jgi:hypothetical protein
MAKTKKKRKKKLRADDAIGLARRPIIEVGVGLRCLHGCFCVWVATEAVWRIDGHLPYHTDPDEPIRFHQCEDQEDCNDDCWGDEGAKWYA